MYVYNKNIVTKKIPRSDFGVSRLNNSKYNFEPLIQWAKTKDIVLCTMSTYSEIKSLSCFLSIFSSGTSLLAHQRYSLALQFFVDGVSLAIFARPKRFCGRIKLIYSAESLRVNYHSAI